MPFEFKTVLEHGTTNPFVARLSWQILEILNHCNASKDMQDRVRDLYMKSLLKKLMRCWEIEERFKEELAAAVSKYKPPAAVNASVQVPQIARLEEECHDFLYGAKNFVRDVLQVVNHLYGTDFKEASEFYRAKKKGSQSLVEFAERTFGADDGKTKFLKDAVPSIEELISMRNAVEQPPSRSCLAHPQRKRSRVPKTRRYRHNVPRLSSISRCLGPTHVRTPFHHLSGDSDLHPLLGARPITASN
jgi:hypothetical protein